MENKENKIIFDINIASVQDLYSILLNKGYDFVTLEPEEEKVSVNPVKTITKKDLEAIYGQRKNEPGFYEAIDILNEALEKDKK